MRILFCVSPFLEPALPGHGSRGLDAGSGGGQQSAAPGMAYVIPVIDQVTIQLILDSDLDEPLTIEQHLRNPLNLPKHGRVLACRGPEPEAHFVLASLLMRYDCIRRTEQHDG